MVGLLLLQSLRTESQEDSQKHRGAGLIGQTKAAQEKQVESHEQRAHCQGCLTLLTS